MSHAKSLRVIGQKLDLAKIALFDLEHDGENYIVTGDSMARTAEWILRYATSEDFVPFRRGATKTPLEGKPIVFTKSDLARLNQCELRRRRDFSESELSLIHISEPTRH